ncbi:MAG: hypothetical protein ACREOZ_02420 [Gloeomargaritales cyanobacterium]
MLGVRVADDLNTEEVEADVATKVVVVAKEEAATEEQEEVQRDQTMLAVWITTYQLVLSVEKRDIMLMSVTIDPLQLPPLEPPLLRRRVMKTNRRRTEKEVV